MKNFKFKSLTMRIWATFTLVILLITLCLSVIYIYIFRYMDVKAKTQDLMEAHVALLESNFDDPTRFDVLRNLRGAHHFTYEDGDAHDVGRPPMRNMLMPNMGNDGQMPQIDNFAVRKWILGFMSPNMYQNSFYQSFNGVNFIFTISHIENGSYFISYMPNYYDNTIIYYMLVVGVIFILLGFVAAKIVANYISKPLSKLENFTMRIAAKDWKEPIKTDIESVLKNEDEIGRLAVSMNKMQEALKRADEEEKVFLQSISHDLKTPVMVIMSHADAIIDGVYIDNLNKTAQIIKDEAISLNKKIKQLLYLNTLDYVLGNQSETSIIELDHLVKHIVEKFEVLGSNLKWNLDIKPVKVKGNEEKLTVAIYNILENAIRYAKSEIFISVKKNEKSARNEPLVRIDIFDDGDPISPENLDKIFQSLFKDKNGNFGLGLAITKKIITFFGGSVYAENREKGVSFIIDYPLA